MAVAIAKTQKEAHMMTVDEVARELRVNPTTVRRWIKEQALPAVELPHRGKRTSYRVLREELLRILSTPTL